MCFRPVNGSWHIPLSSPLFPSSQVVPETLPDNIKAQLNQDNLKLMYVVIASILIMPTPGRLGSFYTNFYRDHYGIKLFESNTEFPPWNYPAFKQFVSSSSETFLSPVLNDPKGSEFYTKILNSITKDQNLQISAVDLGPILVPVPNYASPRK